MKLSALQLEDRATPARYIGDGIVQFENTQLRVFEDWHGGINVLDKGDEVWVGPQPGGGPRVAVLDKNGERTRSDWFAGDKDDRSGIIPVDTGDSKVEPMPVMSSGDGFNTVYVDFDNNQTLEFRKEVMKRVGEIAAPLDANFTTQRPDMLPNKYITLVIGAPTGYQANAIGLAPTAYFNPDYYPMVPRQAYVSVLDSAQTAAVAAHELGHMVGIEHSEVRSSIMFSHDVLLNGVFLDGDLAQVKW